MNEAYLATRAQARLARAPRPADRLPPAPGQPGEHLAGARGRRPTDLPLDRRRRLRRSWTGAPGATAPIRVIFAQPRRRLPRWRRRCFEPLNAAAAVHLGRRRDRAARRHHRAPTSRRRRHAGGGRSCATALGAHRPLTGVRDADVDAASTPADRGGAEPDDRHARPAATRASASCCACCARRDRAARRERCRIPVTGDWLVRVHWRDEDALRRRYSFTTAVPGARRSRTSPRSTATWCASHTGRPHVTAFARPAAAARWPTPTTSASVALRSRGALRTGAELGHALPRCPTGRSPTATRRPAATCRRAVDARGRGRPASPPTLGRADRPGPERQDDERPLHGRDRRARAQRAALRQRHQRRGFCPTGAVVQLPLPDRQRRATATSAPTRCVTSTQPTAAAAWRRCGTRSTSPTAATRSRATRSSATRPRPTARASCARSRSPTTCARAEEVDGRLARARALRLDRQLAHGARHDRPGAAPTELRPELRAAARRAPRRGAPDRRGPRDPPAALRAARHRAVASAPTRTTGARTCASCSSRSSPTATRRTAGAASSTPTRGPSARRCTRARSIGRALAVDRRRPRASRCRMRRWDPGRGGGLVTVIRPRQLPDALVERSRSAASRSSASPTTPTTSSAAASASTCAEAGDELRARLRPAASFPAPRRQPARPAAHRLPHRHLRRHSRRTCCAARRARRRWRRWTHRGADDPGIALLEGAAIVGDILTFYQELYANEAYLRTARWRESVADLVRLIGYRLAPGLGGRGALRARGQGRAAGDDPAGFPLKAQLDGAGPAGRLRDHGRARSRYPHLGRFHLYRPRYTPPIIARHRTTLSPIARRCRSTICAPATGCCTGVRRRARWRASATPRSSSSIAAAELHGCDSTSIQGAPCGARGSRAHRARRSPSLGRTPRHVGRIGAGRSYHRLGPRSVRPLRRDDHAHRALQLGQPSRLRAHRVGHTQPRRRRLSTAISSLDRRQLPLDERRRHDAAAVAGRRHGARQAASRRRAECSCGAVDVARAATAASTWGPQSGAATVLTLDRQLGVDRRRHHCHLVADIRERHRALAGGDPVHAAPPSRRPTLAASGDGPLLLRHRRRGGALPGARCCSPGGRQRRTDAHVAAVDSRRRRRPPSAALLRRVHARPHRRLRRLPARPSRRVAVYGNLVDATQGKTEREAVLGNGDARAVLPDLHAAEGAAHLPARAPARRRRRRPSCEICVDGRLWTRVDSLFGRGPTRGGLHRARGRRRQQLSCSSATARPARGCPPASATSSRATAPAAARTGRSRPAPSRSRRQAARRLRQGVRCPAGHRRRRAGDRRRTRARPRPARCRASAGSSASPTTRPRRWRIPGVAHGARRLDSWSTASRGRPSRC